MLTDILNVTCQKAIYNIIKLFFQRRIVSEVSAWYVVRRLDYEFLLVWCELRTPFTAGALSSWCCLFLFPNPVVEEQYEKVASWFVWVTCVSPGVTIYKTITSIKRLYLNLRRSYLLKSTNTGTHGCKPNPEWIPWDPPPHHILTFHQRTHTFFSLFRHYFFSSLYPATTKVSSTPSQQRTNSYK